MYRKIKLALQFALLIGLLSCHHDPTENELPIDAPNDKYIGNNTTITLSKGCDNLDVNNLILYIKAPDGSIIRREAIHKRLDEFSQFELTHGLSEETYHLLYIEYEKADEDGKLMLSEYGLGCRIQFERGTTKVLSNYNDRFEMYSSGTETDTLYVTSYDKIIRISQMANDVRHNSEFNDNTYFLQVRDIDGDILSRAMSKEYGWLPIGYQSSLPFRGTYDGGGHTISKLWVNREYMSPVGFVGFSKGARICNLRMTNLNLKGDMAVAGIVGVATSSEGERKLTYIDNCQVEDSSIAGAELSYAVGGILGIVDYESQAHVQRCQSLKNKISAHSQAGGVVGAGARTSSLVTYLCENSSEVSSEFNSSGGIVGMCDTLTAGACINRGNIVGAYKFTSKSKERGESNVGCGGIAGGTGVSFFAGCKNEGEIVGRSGVGGIVGSARFIGGDPDDEGYMYNNVAIYYCSNSAPITGDELVGGLCGEAQIGVFGGYNSGNVAARENYAGGIVANGALAVVHNSINDGCVYADSYAGGIVGMTTTCSLAANQNYGDIEAANSHGAGIVAIMGNRGTVTYCSNYGNIFHSTIDGKNTRALTVSEYFAGIVGQAGDPNEWSTLKIAGIVYAASEMIIGIAGIPFAALSVATIPGKAVWSALSSATLIAGTLSVFMDTLILGTSVSDKIGYEEARKEQEESYKILEEECSKIEATIESRRSSYAAILPSNFSATLHNETYHQHLGELVDYITVSTENSSDFNNAINQSQYDKMVDLNDQALAKDITHSIISGLCIIVSAVGSVASIIATGGAATPIVASAIVGGVGATLGGANAIWESCTTYISNVDEISQNSNYGMVYAYDGSKKVGGIIGVAEENVIIRDCFNSGLGTAGGHLAGEMYHQAELLRSLSIADEDSWGGKIYSSKDNNASLEDIFYYTTSETQTMSGAQGLTNSEIYDQSKYTNWDFDPATGLWEMPNNSEGSFPVINKSRFAVNGE